jgi:hypothetical protein
MPSETQDGGTFASVDDGASVDWTTPSNAQTSNDSRTIASAVGGGPTTETDFLDITNFGFNVSGTINGIEVSVERRKTGSGTLEDSTIQLIKGGTAQGDNKAVAGAWPASDTVATYGGASDLWGLTWSANDINATDFGVRVQGINNHISNSDDAEVDFVSITVTYTAGGTSMRRLSVLKSKIIRSA